MTVGEYNESNRKETTLKDTILIERNVRDVLVNGTVDGEVFRIAEPLDRALYLRVNKVLEALGGKWNKRLNGHRFDAPPDDVIEVAVATGHVVDLKKRFQFYETPKAVAEVMVQLLHLADDLSDGISILEPSAGHGALLRALPKSDDVTISAIEVDPAKADVLETEFPHVTVLEYDFLALREVGNFDYVIMNPPFTRMQDIDHVNHAFGMLREGGRLVACMSTAWQFRGEPLAANFRALMQHFKGETIENPAGAFKSSGTDVNTVLVALNR